MHRPKWDDAGEATTVWGEINPPFFIYGWKAGPELPEIGLDGAVGPGKACPDPSVGTIISGRRLSGPKEDGQAPTGA